MLAAEEDKIRASGVLKSLEKFSVNYVLSNGNYKQTAKTLIVEISLGFALAMRQFPST